MLAMKLFVANWVTISRLVFFGFFIWYAVHHQILIAASFFLIAWALDAVDGWVARALGEVSKLGSWLDKIVDRCLMVGAGVLLVYVQVIPAIALLLFVKDLLLLPAAVVAWRQKRFMPGAGVAGKAATFLQGVGLLWLMFGWPLPLLIIIPTAWLGLYTAYTYTKQFLTPAQF